MSAKLKYSDHLDMLVALVTHLSATRFKSRTPNRLANSLGLDQGEVTRVLTGFRGLFRESRTTDSKTGEKFYTLHLRYALRSQDAGDEGSEDVSREPLPGDQLTALIDFIRHTSAQERLASTTALELKWTKLGVWITAAVATLGALISAGLLSWLGLVK